MNFSGDLIAELEKLSPLTSSSRRASEGNEPPAKKRCIDKQQSPPPFAFNPDDVYNCHYKNDSFEAQRNTVEVSYPQLKPNQGDHEVTEDSTIMVSDYTSVTSTIDDATLINDQNGVALIAKNYASTSDEGEGDRQGDAEVK